MRVFGWVLRGNDQRRGLPGGLVVFPNGRRLCFGLERWVSGKRYKFSKEGAVYSESLDKLCTAPDRVDCAATRTDSEALARVQALHPNCSRRKVHAQCHHSACPPFSSWRREADSAPFAAGLSQRLFHGRVPSTPKRQQRIQANPTMPRTAIQDKMARLDKVMEEKRCRCTSSEGEQHRLPPAGWQ